MSDVVFDLEIIVVNYKTPEMLKGFLDSLDEFPPKSQVRVTVVDVEEACGLYPMKHDNYYHLSENLGYAKACNLAAQGLTGRNLAFFNADTRFVDGNCVDRCVEFLDSHPEVGIVGPLQYSSGHRVTHGGFFGTHRHPVDNGFKSHVTDAFRTDRQAVTVSGSAFFIKRSVWDLLTQCPVYQKQFPDVRGAFLPTQHYYEETGCAYHAAAHGYQVWYLGSAEMIHEWHKSSPVGSMAKHVSPSRRTFSDFCDVHGIEH